MCKHVAAVLYGVGARLDQDPSLFFKLRKIDVNDLIIQAVEEKTQKLLKKSENKSARVIEDSDLSDIFGIEMDEPAKAASPKAEQDKLAVRDEPVQKAGVKKSGKKELEIRIGNTRISFNFQFGKKASKAKPAKEAVRKEAAKTKQGKKSVADTVTGLIGRSRKGIAVSDIQMKTGLDIRQIRNAIYMAKKRGEIKSVRRGVYKKA
jgi:uncharacterized Zn finger protein